jgi:adenine-specific DNA-methyltransferase
VTWAEEIAPAINRDVGEESSGSAAFLDALAIIEPWWKIRVDRAGLPERWGHLETALEIRPPSNLPSSSSNSRPYSAFELGATYVNSLDAHSRRENGRHYTPAELAERLWVMLRKALRFGVDDRALPGLLRDPAVGAGALLVPPIREHLRASEAVDPVLVLNSLPNFIEGIDNDPWAVYLANVVLAAEMLPTLARVPAALRRPLPALARVGDGLDAGLPPAHSWIMNPPYGRMRLSDERREQFANSLYGHANLYGLFLAAALEKTAPEGAIAALVPTSFSSGLYFSRLRKSIQEHAPLRALAFVHSRNGVFNGVLQETCLAVFSPKTTRAVKIERIDASVSSVATVRRLAGGGDPWLIPRESSDAALAVAANRLPLSLASAGWHASTGPLVWNRRRSDLFKTGGSARARIVWASDIEPGKIVRDPSRDEFRYLKLTGTDRSVMLLTEPAVLVQRTTAPEQSRRLVVAELPELYLADLGGSVVVENHVNVLRPSVAEPLLTRATLVRLLSSPTFDRLMRCMSGSVAVSSYELAALPLPNAATLKEWNSLGAIELDAAIAVTYRLTP